MAGWVARLLAKSLALGVGGQRKSLSGRRLASNGCYKLLTLVKVELFGGVRLRGRPGFHFGASGEGGSVFGVSAGGGVAGGGSFLVSSSITLKTSSALMAVISSRSPRSGPLLVGAVRFNPKRRIPGSKIPAPILGGIINDANSNSLSVTPLIREAKWLRPLGPVRLMSPFSIKCVPKEVYVPVVNANSSSLKEERAPVIPSVGLSSSHQISERRLVKAFIPCRLVTVCGRP